MGGAQAAKTLLQIRKAALERSGTKLTESEEATMLEEIRERYDRQSSPYYAAARMWVDEVIAPDHTRSWISRGLEVADLNPEIAVFNPGIIQT